MATVFHPPEHIAREEMGARGTPPMGTLPAVIQLWEGAISEGAISGEYSRSRET